MAAERLPLATSPTARIKDASLVVFANNVINNLFTAPASGYFPAPPIDSAAMVIYADEYATALAAAINGSKAQTKVKDDKKKNLIDALRVNVMYVNSINVSSNVDDYALLRVRITASGYELSKVPAPVGPLAEPAQFQAYPPVVNRRPQPGKIRLRYKRAKTMEGQGTGTKWQWKLHTAAEWNAVQNSSSRIDLVGLTSGELYDFKCVQIGAQGVTATESITLTVGVI